MDAATTARALEARLSPGLHARALETMRGAGWEYGDHVPAWCWVLVFRQVLVAAGIPERDLACCPVMAPAPPGGW